MLPAQDAISPAVSMFTNINTHFYCRDNQQSDAEKILDARAGKQGN